MLWVWHKKEKKKNKKKIKENMSLVLKEFETLEFSWLKL